MRKTTENRRRPTAYPGPSSCGRTDPLQACTLLLVILLLTAPTCLAAGDSNSGGMIRGTVTGPAHDEFTQEMLNGRHMMHYSGTTPMHGDDVVPYSLSEEVVVYIESVDADTVYSVPSLHPKLNQHNMMFRPLVLPVLAGTTVDFPNKDNLYHNVFSYSQPKEFDLGKYPIGHSRSVTFEKPGIVNVFCEIHTYMYATILVLRNPYFTVPDENGSYEIGGIPPGKYRLSCWYGRKKISTQPVTVQAGQTTVANFAL